MLNNPKHATGAGRRIKIFPSILNSDLGDLRSVIHALDSCHADGVHIDVMDGNFVPNITFGPGTIAAIRNASSLHFEAHLMISNPEKYIAQFAEAGADSIIVHYEASQRLAELSSTVKSMGKGFGIALNPQTEVGAIKPYISSIDTLLIMSVNPGFGGQKFMPGSIDKIKAARMLLDNSSARTTLAVDGGINQHTCPDAIAGGADELIIGSAIFGNGGVSNNLKEFMGICTSATSADA